MDKEKVQEEESSNLLVTDAEIEKGGRVNQMIGEDLAKAIITLEDNAFDLELKEYVSNSRCSYRLAIRVLLSNF